MLTYYFHALFRGGVDLFRRERVYGYGENHRAETKITGGGLQKNHKTSDKFRALAAVNAAHLRVSHGEFIGIGVGVALQ